MQLNNNQLRTQRSSLERNLSVYDLRLATHLN